jgi:hypothetical protein
MVPAHGEAKMAKSPINTAFEIKSRVWANPDRSAKDIHEELVKLGSSASLSTVSTYRVDFLNSVAVLRELGALPPASPQVEQPKAAKAKRGKAAEAKPSSEPAAADAELETALA